MQTQQGPNSANYDTVAGSYSWSGGYRTLATSLPCSQHLGNQCGTVHTEYHDMMGRVIQSATNSNETVTNTVSENDVLGILSPAPAGENNKQVQQQFDGLGRLQYSCAIGNGATTPCGQNTGSANGVTTAFSYTYGSGSSTVTQTRISQTRSKTYDAMGRVTQISTPEGGSRYDYYDSYSSCPSGYAGAKGQLAAVQDPNGNLLCYAYDSLNRVIGVNANSTTCRHFYYDNSTGYGGSIPSGVSAPMNPYGRMVEAATDNCSSGTLTTDEWFGYDKDGHITDMWEKTPNSNQYYHSTATFFGNDSVNVLTLASPSLLSATYGLDGEGRLNALTMAEEVSNGHLHVMGPGRTLVSNTTYNAASQPTNIAIGTNTDQDSFVYDSNTGRMTSWTFQVGNTPSTQTGVMNWNPNGTLNNLAITDGFNAAGTQTCYYNPSSGAAKGYDDLGRLLTVSCGTNGAIWNQTFTYDQYDNLTKYSAGPGISWMPGYSATSNHYTLGGATYDSNGNVTDDTMNAYAYNEFSKLKSINAAGTNCAIGGECIVCDAFGRAVEIDSGSASAEIWYTQLGKTAFMNGSTYNYSYWAGPGGSTLLDQNDGYHFEHKDWLHNARVSSDVLEQSIIQDQAFAPYGEIYENFGSAGANENIFTGDTQDIMSTGDCCFDTPNRELSANQGRWLSPDPVGASWNTYAYTTNPNSFTDPTGLIAGGPFSGFVSCPGGFNGCREDSWDEFDILGLWVNGQKNPLMIIPTSWIQLYVDPESGDNFGVVDFSDGRQPLFYYPNNTVPGIFDFSAFYANYANSIRASRDDGPPTPLQTLKAIAADLQKLPDLCNAGVGATARLGSLGGDFNVNQNGVEGSLSYDRGPVSANANGEVSVSAGGELFGGTVTVDPSRGTVDNVAAFAGIETPSRAFELQVNVHADVVQAGSCP